ncbi:MAG: sigma-54-dependent Fis family transcriptional regulator [Muribaculaceae bacterium]|nr:sigma-54-dependent Fis family transcriptional regulator [Muribaculaceae bacterium]
MGNNFGKILIVDDNLGVRRTLKVVLSPHFEEILTIGSPNEISTSIREFKPDVVLLDMNFKATINSGNEGLFYLKEIKSKYPGIEVVLFTAYGDIPLAVEGMKRGAFDFIEKPWDNDNLIETLRKAVAKSKRKPKSDPKSYDSIYWGSTSKIEEIREVIDKVAPTDISILITGENGVGKDLVAKEIFSLSDRNDKPFVAVDMGAITDTLFESELFGHMKGSFTGAVSDHKGKFEQAQEGTIFLDEIGNLSLTSQAKLLRALQNRVITKVGGNKEIPIDIRIISATNKDLKKEVAEGRFREDLFYRLAGLQIAIPSLRERKEDIIGLANHFLQIYSNKYHKNVESIAKEAVLYLQEYNWPGNIRELKQQIEKAVIFSEGETLKFEDLKAGVQQDCYGCNKAGATKDEKTLISDALMKTGRNISKAAKLLNMSRPTLYSKMNKYNL